MVLKLCGYVQTIKVETLTKFYVPTYSFVATAGKNVIPNNGNEQFFVQDFFHIFLDRSIKLHRALQHTYAEGAMHPFFEKKNKTKYFF